MTSHKTECYGVVYSPRYGGFGVSEKGLWWLAERGHPMAQAELEAFTSGVHGAIFSSQSYLRNIDRDDPLLVECVNTLEEEASGSSANLVVEDVPLGSNWDIDEHDGNERLRVWPRSVNSGK